MVLDVGTTTTQRRSGHAALERWFRIILQSKRFRPVCKIADSVTRMRPHSLEGSNDGFYEEKKSNDLKKSSNDNYESKNEANRVLS